MDGSTCLVTVSRWSLQDWLRRFYLGFHGTGIVKGGRALVARSVRLGMVE